MRKSAHQGNEERCHEQFALLPLNCLRGLGMRSISIAYRLINLRPKDFVLIATGAPGGLTIIDQLPEALKEPLSEWLKKVIAIFPDFMAEKVWAPLGQLLASFHVPLPEIMFDPLSGLFALLVMFFSSVWTGNRESTGRLIQRAYRLSESYKFEPDRWVNRITYPGFIVFSALFFWPLFFVTAGGFGGGFLAAIVPSVLFIPFLMGAVRGMYKSVPIQGNDSDFFDRVHYSSAAIISLINTGICTTLCLGLAQLQVGDAVATTAPWWAALLPIWLTGFMIVILQSANWRSLPIMLLWAAGLLISDRISAAL